MNLISGGGEEDGVRTNNSDDVVRCLVRWLEYVILFFIQRIIMVVVLVCYIMNRTPFSRLVCYVHILHPYEEE